jgi:hypothetical protein
MERVQGMSQLLRMGIGDNDDALRRGKRCTREGEAGAGRGRRPRRDGS